MVVVVVVFLMYPFLASSTLYYNETVVKFNIMSPFYCTIATAWMGNGENWRKEVR